MASPFIRSFRDQPAIDLAALAAIQGIPTQGLTPQVQPMPISQAPSIGGDIPIAAQARQVPSGYSSSNLLSFIPKFAGELGGGGEIKPGTGQIDPTTGKWIPAEVAHSFWDTVAGSHGKALAQGINVRHGTAEDTARMQQGIQDKAQQASMQTANKQLDIYKQMISAAGSADEKARITQQAIDFANKNGVTFDPNVATSPLGKGAGELALGAQGLQKGEQGLQSAVQAMPGMVDLRRESAKQELARPGYENAALTTLQAGPEGVASMIMPDKTIRTATGGIPTTAVNEISGMRAGPGGYPMPYSEKQSQQGGVRGAMTTETPVNPDIVNQVTGRAGGMGGGGSAVNPVPSAFGPDNVPPTLTPELGYGTAGQYGGYNPSMSTVAPDVAAPPGTSSTVPVVNPTPGILGNILTNPIPQQGQTQGLLPRAVGGLWDAVRQGFGRTLSSEQ